MGLATLATRISGPVVMRRVRVTPRVEAFLESMSMSVLVALVAGAIASGGLRTGGAVVVAVVVMLALRNAVGAMVSGMALAALWSALIV